MSSTNEAKPDVLGQGRELFAFLETVGMKLPLEIPPVGLDEASIYDASGACLARTTSFAAARDVAAYLVRSANLFPHLFMTLRLLRDAFNEACSQCDFERARRTECEQILADIYLKIENDMKAQRIIPMWEVKSPMGRAKAYVRRMQKELLEQKGDKKT